MPSSSALVHQWETGCNAFAIVQITAGDRVSRAASGRAAVVLPARAVLDRDLLQQFRANEIADDDKPQRSRQRVPGTVYIEFRGQYT